MVALSGLIASHGRAAACWMQDHREVTAVGVAVVSGGVLIHYGSRLWSVRKLNQARMKKTADRQASLDKWIKHVNNDRITDGLQKEILKLSATELCEGIKIGKFTVKQALRAYQQQAISAHQKTNCIVEPIWEAEEWARNLDNREERRGLLFGVPISIKDNYAVKGYDCTLGCAKFIDQPLTEDCITVRTFRREGAIPFVKTTVPQTMMSMETSSPLFGQTTNPFDSARISGGSSGGEGSLIGLHGSPLGLAGDIGGSIRFPCHCCGVMGFKPTAKRTSSSGIRGPTEGQNVVLAGYGPMAPDVEGVVVGFKVMLHQDIFEYDFSVPPLPFNDKVYEDKGKLRIGYYTDDGAFACTPACKRAVDVAKKLLEGMGHELIPFDVSPFSKRAVTYFMRCMTADKGQSMLTILKNDLVDNVLRGTIAFYKMGKYVKLMIAGLLRLVGEVPLANMLACTTGADSVHDWYQFVNEVDRFRFEMTSHVQSQRLNAILGPSYPAPAPTIGTWGKATGTGSYTFLYNMLDFPTGCLPVTKVTKADEEAMKDYPVPDLWHRSIKKSSEKGTVGLPLNVTIAALPWRDEICLRIMRDLQEALQA